MRSAEQYWTKRALELESDLHLEAQLTYDKLDVIISQALDFISQLINDWYGRYMPDGRGDYIASRKRLTLSELSQFKSRFKRYLVVMEGYDDERIKRLFFRLEQVDARTNITRLEALQKEVQAVSTLLHAEEERIISELAERQFKQGYYRTYFDVFQNLGFGFSPELLDDAFIEDILSKPWAPDGLTFYERILRNDRMFLTEAQKLIIKHLHLGTSPDKVISELSKTMNRTRRSASTMVMSEGAFFANEARADCMRNLDVERYRIIATLDMKTSEICREMDGKVYPMKDYLAGATAPPFHVRCRTTTAPYYADMDSFAQRIARGANGDTYYVPANMQYKDWYKQYIEG